MEGRRGGDATRNPGSRGAGRRTAVWFASVAQLAKRAFPSVTGTDEKPYSASTPSGWSIPVDSNPASLYFPTVEERVLRKVLKGKE